MFAWTRNQVITVLTMAIVLAHVSGPLPVKAQSSPGASVLSSIATPDAPSPVATTQAPPADWSIAVVESTMKRYPTAEQLGSWGYARSLYLYGQYLVWKRTGDARYLEYIKGWVDSHVDENGNMDKNMNALDNMLPGNLLLVLYQETNQPKYKLAAEQIRRRFDDYPRTSDGGFWHATGASRQHQLWADGVFMSMPFLIRYGQVFADSAYANDEATRQLLVYGRHLQSAANGLLYHAYDESGASSWADPATHHSREFWCRAIGWYGMTTIEVLEILPADHPARPQLISILKNLIKGLVRYQDKKTGLWYEVVDKGNLSGNWHETSSSSMYTYVISMAVKRGYISSKYKKVARKGYQGVLTKVAVGPDGLTELKDICEGTNVGDLAFYLARKRNVNDFHGLGAFLIMNEHMVASGSNLTKGR